jgi:signal peptidase II
MGAPSKGSYRAMHFSISLVVVALDQLTKWVVSRDIPLNGARNVIPKFFSISHVLNPGAAFSLFAESDPRYTTKGLILFSSLVLIGIAWVLWKSAPGFSRVSVALSFIFGGALGNLLDRIALGSVRDFLAFDFGSYHWPDFNLADTFIVSGSLLLILDVLLTRGNPQSGVEPAADD